LELVVVDYAFISACLTPKKTECLTPKNGVFDAEKRRILYRNRDVKHAPDGVNTAR
jgi:hypothetical protein